MEIISPEKRRLLRRDTGMRVKKKIRGGLEVTAHSIIEASSTLKIAVESVGDVEHALDVLHAERLAFVHSQSLGGADGVFDL